MWGSDNTRTGTLHTYAEAVNFLRYTHEVSESDKEMMFSTTIRRLLRWPDAAASSYSPTSLDHSLGSASPRLERGDS
jgi:hypothetical protein